MTDDEIFYQLIEQCVEGKYIEVTKDNFWTHYKEMIFYECCKSGAFEAVQYFKSENLCATESRQKDAFVGSCLNGQGKIAKWLYSFGMIDLDKLDGFTKLELIEGCLENGHSEIAKWLSYIKD